MKLLPVLLLALVVVGCDTPTGPSKTCVKASVNTPTSGLPDCK